MKIKLIAYLLVLTLVISVGFVQAWDVDYDLGGETVTIVSGWSGWEDTHFARFRDGAGRAWVAEVEEMFNCKIVFETEASGWDFDRIRAAVLTGDADIDFLIGQFHWVFANTDFVFPGYYDILEDEYFKRTLDTGFHTLEEFTFGTRAYMLPWPQNANPAGVLFNKEIFAREGLPCPYELFWNDEWTYETFIDIAVMASADTTGDGNIDQYGSSWPAYYANGQRPVDNVDGRLVVTADRPEYIEALGLPQPQDHGAAQYHSSERWRFTNGNAAMYASTMSYSDWPELKTMEDDWGFVPAPRGPSVDSIYSDNYIFPQGHVEGFYMPVNVENPRAKIEVISALFKFAEPYIDKESRSEEYWYDWAEMMNVRDAETIETYKFANQRVFSYIWGWPDSGLEIGGSVSAIESNKARDQLILDDRYNR